MAIDWSKVLKNHIGEACRRYDVGENRPTHPARTTFLIRNGEWYPAKFIRGLAYEIATGDKLSSEEYSGGMETVRFLSDLGFSVEYNGEVIDAIRKPGTDQKTTNRIPDTATKKRIAHLERCKRIF